MAIEFRVNAPVTTDHFIELMKNASPGESPLLQDPARVRSVIAHSNLIVTAWEGSVLVGIARSLTDFYCVCYLSDLAVHRVYQNCGIGTRLQSLTREQLGPVCELILIASTSASSYYGRLGYIANNRCWILEAGSTINK